MKSTFDTSAAMERRFEEYVHELGAVVGHDARRRGLGDYVGGLLLPGGRKSMEPIAERLDPDHVSRRHQAIQHFVSEANWSDAAVRERVRAQVIPALRARAPIEHLILDDTTLPKSGRHSVGVAVQYCGRIHATANCQTLVSLSLSNGHDSLPVACELYLPESWAHDRKRRLHAGVPPAVRFRTKPEIALDQLRWAAAAGLPGRVVLMDAAYGGVQSMRGGVREMVLSDFRAACRERHHWIGSRARFKRSRVSPWTARIANHRRPPSRKGERFMTSGASGAGIAGGDTTSEPARC